MSWLFSQALVEAFSEAHSLDGEPCAQLNVMPTAHPFLRNDKPMDFSKPSQFGLTSQHLTDDHGEELLTWFLAGFHARTSASPARAPGSMAIDRDCGSTWPVSLAKFDRASCSWKTVQQSLFEDSASSSVIWPRSGMTHDGQCWELPTLELRTNEIDSGLWLPTPCTVDTGSMFNKSASEGAALRPTLGAMAKHDLWPTPTVHGNHNQPGASKNAGWGLSSAVKQWPTPTASLGTKGSLVTPRNGREGGTLIEAVSARKKWPTPHGFSADGKSNGPSGNELGRAVNQSLVATPTARDWKSGKASEATHAKNSRPLSEQIGGSLNPTWVEWLMGWPIGWTDLKPLATAKYHSVQQPLGAC